MVAKKWNLEQLTEENLKEQIESATEAGKNADVTEPRAEAVHYDRLDNRIIIKLRNGAISSFPPHLVQGLVGASPEQINDFFITPGGRSIRWESLDLDFSIPGLVANTFGTKEWMAELGRQGGRKTSIAKAESSRKNGAKGGRPKKASPQIEEEEIAQKVTKSHSAILDATQQMLEDPVQRKHGLD